MLAPPTHQRARAAAPAARAPVRSRPPGPHAAALALSRGSTASVQRQPDAVSCDPAAMTEIGPGFRKPEADVKALGLGERTLGRPAAGASDFVLFCPHASTRPLKKLVPCSTVYWIAEAGERGAGKDEVWAQQEGESELFRGFVKSAELHAAPPSECIRLGTTTVEHAPKPKQTPKLAINAQRTGPGTTMGHAFISLTNDAGERHQWGFYPACSQCSGFGNCSTVQQLDIISGGAVDGVVCNDDNSNPDTRYEVAITMEQYDKGRARILEMTLNPPKYDLFVYSCVGFMSEVAGHLGLALPDFPGVDEPDDVANEIDKRLIADGSFGIESLSGDPVDLSKEKPYFKVKGLPPIQSFNFRWMVVSSEGDRFLMRNDVGVALNYSRTARDAYIGDASRELMRKKGVREGKILCRISPTSDEADPDTKLVEKPVKFTW